MPSLESLLERLLRHQVEFVIVGGFAAVAHGVSLMTQDVDLCCPFTAENLFRLQEALNDLHPFHRMTPQRLPLELTPDLVARLKNLYLMTDFGQLDCLGEVKGIGGFEAVKAQSIEVQLPFGPCRVLGIDGLIKSKLAIGRPQDKLAILQLRAIEERTQRGKDKHGGFGAG